MKPLRRRPMIDGEIRCRKRAHDRGSERVVEVQPGINSLWEPFSREYWT